jgi:hypothetical protein
LISATDRSVAAAKNGRIVKVGNSGTAADGVAELVRVGWFAAMVKTTVWLS